VQAQEKIGTTSWNGFQDDLRASDDGKREKEARMDVGGENRRYKVVLTALYNFHRESFIFAEMHGFFPLKISQGKCNS
jgi:hypothetical protein